MKNLGLSLIYGKYEKRKELFYIDFQNIKVRNDVIGPFSSLIMSIDYFTIDYNAKLRAIYPVFLKP